MNQEDYRAKMHDLLGDDTTFSPISDKLKKSKHITPDDYKIFISNLSNSAYIYGLPKIHKPDVPLRPIIAYHHSPAYPLAKFLSNYLSPLLQNHRNIYSIRSTPHFINELTALKPAPHFTMCSFDVTSLYLSLPHNLIIDSLERFLDSQSVNSHTASSIVQLTKLCLSMNCFTFQENHYRQIKGSPMGSPLSSIVAEVAMSEIDNWITRTLPIDIQIWRRYIDDVFCLCRHGQESTILAALNSFKPQHLLHFGNRIKPGHPIPRHPNNTYRILIPHHSLLQKTVSPQLYPFQFTLPHFPQNQHSKNSHQKNLYPLFARYI
ncbi:hypothetical protein LAZ67_9000450 [Cordylochernes scorpioides]|uniref:Reverse transcriptase domain-containing protein n=1 Tax=Cordylochernes scorpioides TaxID=51811 RepID=A0ABY6KT67_9ARAC|nr:hypothetical protein LAZ67_9000450 [Cordylochernes scorpioides]